jgi:hypothetical protein
LSIAVYERLYRSYSLVSALVEHPMCSLFLSL